MMAYSLGFRVLKGKPNVGLDNGVATIFSIPARWKDQMPPLNYELLIAAISTGIVGCLVWWLLGSELGLLLRATGNNRALVEARGRRPAIYDALGLAVGNGLVAISAVLVSSRDGFVDIGSGVGIIVTLIACLVLGEQALRSTRSIQVKRVLGPLLGTFLYFFFYLLILRSSVRGWLPFTLQPTDLRLVSALVLIGAVYLRRFSQEANQAQDILPL